MKIKDVKNSSFYKAIREINYKKERSCFINLLKKNIIDELEESSHVSNDFWYSRTIYFINCFFSDYSTPKSLNLDDIFEYSKKNKSSKLHEYIGITNINQLNTITIHNEPIFMQHSYILMILQSNNIIRTLFMLNTLSKCLKEKEIKYYLNNSFTYIVRNTIYQINLNKKNIIISDNETNYTFKEKEFEKFIETKELHDQPIELIKMFFY